MTRTRAWDHAMGLMQPVHLLGGQREPTAAQARVIEALDALVGQPLPLAAIPQIAEAVLAAWQAGREAT